MNYLLVLENYTAHLRRVLIAHKIAIPPLVAASSEPQSWRNDIAAVSIPTEKCVTRSKSAQNLFHYMQHQLETSDQNLAAAEEKVRSQRPKCIDES